MMATYPDDVPVNSDDRTAASHLAWLDKVLIAINDMQAVIYELAGGQDGVFLYGISGDLSLAVLAQDTPGMTVKIHAGIGMEDGVPCFKSIAENTAAMTAPASGLDRIDVVSLNLSTRTFVVTTGVEHASPSAPSTPANSIKLAEIYHRDTETSIQNTDDSTNGYITDARFFVNV